MESSRWFATGGSDLSDPRAAGVQATERAGIRDDARLLVVFFSEALEAEELLAGIRSRAPDVPLIGCSTAGEIATTGPSTSSVVVSAFGGDDFSVATTAAKEISRSMDGAGQEVAACINEVADQPHKVLMLLTDGLAGDQTAFVRGVYRKVGAAVPLVGGCAGDDLHMRATVQLHGNEVLRDAAVAAAISSPAPLGIGVEHGWQPIGNPMLVTSSSEAKVLRLDDRPALDVYLERLDVPAAVRNDQEEFTRFAMRHPLGLRSRSGEEVRFIGGADFEERSLQTIAAVPQGALVWLMTGDEGSVLDATDGACQQALSGLAGQDPLGFLAFDCIARHGVLGDTHVADEVARIAKHANGMPVAGFYTYGEIARTRGPRGFHNQTLVVLAVS